MERGGKSMWNGCYVLEPCCWWGISHWLGWFIRDFPLQSEPSVPSLHRKGEVEWFATGTAPLPFPMSPLPLQGVCTPVFVPNPFFCSPSHRNPGSGGRWWSHHSRVRWWGHGTHPTVSHSASPTWLQDPVWVLLFSFFARHFPLWHIWSFGLLSLNFGTS